MTYPEFSSGGRFGCAHCYQTFGPFLKNFLKKIHGSENHSGKGPVSQKEGITLKLLKQKLNALIQQEEYEQAAKVRDDIRALEKKINNDLWDGTSDEG